MSDTGRDEERREDDARETAEPSGHPSRRGGVERDGGGERLPWLEAVDEEEGEGPSALKLIAAVVVGLLTIAIVVGGLFWLGNRNRHGDTEVIAAPQGPYKVRPDHPGGMQVEGTGQSQYAASQGQAPQASLNANALPEQPVSRPQPGANNAAQNQAHPQQAAPAEPHPAPPAPVQPAHPAPAAHPTPATHSAPAQQQASNATAGGPTVQLGAFSSQASANAAWNALAGRFHYLAPLNHSVTTVESGGRTLYRLRANGAQAGDVCRRLQMAGETCSPVS